jgi:hypothetical protein
MSVLHRLSQVRYQRRRRGEWHRIGALRQPGGEGDAGAVGRGDVTNLADLAGLIDGHNVGVVQAGRRPRLVLKAQAQVSVDQHAGRRDLEGDVAA